MGVVNGLVLIKPSTCSFTGTAASIPTAGGLGQGGGQIAYTAVTNLTVDEVFALGYDEYYIFMSCTSSTNTADLTLRFRSFGQTLTSSFYTSQVLNDAYSETTVTFSRTISGASIPMAILGNTNSGNNLISMTVYDPYAPVKTSTRIDSASGRTTNNVRQVQATYNQAVYVDGLSIDIASGTISGTMSIYGLRK